MPTPLPPSDPQQTPPPSAPPPPALPILNARQCRVLGVLIEKAQTTPGQYPLTLNGLVNGANQLSARDPVMHLDEEAVLDALDAMKKLALVREVMLEGSRVPKFRHTARDTLAITTEQLVLLAELLLRGPQSVGSLRGNASRMTPIDSLETAQSLLDAMANRTDASGAALPPLVRQVPPPPGTRAVLYAQLLAPDAHPIAMRRDTGGGSSATSSSDDSANPLTARIEALEAEVKVLRTALSRFAIRLAEPDPFE